MIFIMLVGMPCSGKSTLRKYIQLQDTFASISSDDYIKFVAQAANSTYNEVFKTAIKSSKFYMNAVLDSALQNNNNIIWDQTNLTEESRTQKLKKIPNSYKKVCISLLSTDLGVLLKRNKSVARETKTIPDHVFSDMRARSEKPKLSEGFDTILNMESVSAEDMIVNRQMIKDLLCG